MAPLMLPCLCTEVKVPALVKTNEYKVQASIQGCSTNYYLKYLHLNLGLPLEDQFYWNNCQCNEYDGLRRRHLLGDIPGYIPGNPAIKLLEKQLVLMSHTFEPFRKVDHKTLLANTRSCIKSRYKSAYLQLRAKVVNLSTKQSLVKAFVKYEKIPIGKYEAGKPPRMIQFRDFTYLYSLKRELLPFSMSVKNGVHKWDGQEVKTIFTKVYDNYGVANALYTSWTKFVDPVAVCLDHSKFDGHYCRELLELEHKFWKSLNNSRMLEWLLGQQLVNRGTTPHGLYYKVNGGRMSGEYTTSDGNSLMNYAMLRTWCRSHGLKDDEVYIHVNGDDSVLICERSKADDLRDLDYFRNFNMETECDRIVDDFRMISYCQAQPVRVKRNGEIVWYMVKEPLRTLSRMQYCDKKFEKIIQRYTRGVGLCELAVNSGIPITQQLSCNMIYLGDKPLGCVDKSPALNSGNDIEVKSIDPLTRVDYEVAFGITAINQMMIESQLAGNIRSTDQNNLNSIISRYKTFHKH